MRLFVSPDQRGFQQEDGTPFFYLADTAWELIHRLTREEAQHYLQDRAAKRFNVILTVALSEQDGLRSPNAYGDRPLHDLDPTQPDEAYFAHVDWIVERAAALGLYVALLPTWGDKWNVQAGAGPEVFTPENAYRYGEKLGRRYRDRSTLIWVLGGDRSVDTPSHRDTQRALASGLARGDGGRHLMTFHPKGGRSSSQDFHGEPWLDFNLLQSGHCLENGDNAEMIAADLVRQPPKPTLDGEPCYEGHPVMTLDWKQVGNEWFGEDAVRRAAYKAVFAGAAGHTYGCHDIWQMWTPTREPINGARTPWPEALHLPGAGQMRHLRTLIETPFYASRRPDRELAGGGGFALRSTDGTHASIYIPEGRPLTVQLDRLARPSVGANWFDPRSGESAEIGEFLCRGEREFIPPTAGDGQDWVLTLD